MASGLPSKEENILTDIVMYRDILGEKIKSSNWKNPSKDEKEEIVNTCNIILELLRGLDENHELQRHLNINANHSAFQTNVQIGFRNLTNWLENKQTIRDDIPEQKMSKQEMKSLFS